MKDKIQAFTAEIVKELGKVTWPTKDELKDSTMIVASVCSVLALFIFLVDNLLSLIVKYLY
ncbi:MAG: preprotein translocase subunit SecE [Ignavibacteria bacterium]|nr:preprotein translocase subunit SecE [Ignavibacteria bacterium]